MKGVLYYVFIIPLINYSLAVDTLTAEGEEVSKCLGVKVILNEGSCNSQSTGMTGNFKCCYVEKIEKEIETNVHKSCVRLYFDEESIRIHNRRLQDDYKDIKILCSSGYLVLSLFVLIALLL